MLFSKSAWSSESFTSQWYVLPEAPSCIEWALTSGSSIPITKIRACRSQGSLCDARWVPATTPHFNYDTRTRHF